MVVYIEREITLEGDYMRWIKHDTRASSDPKICYLRMEYGLEGYGLYWYLLESIAASVGEPDFEFTLEADTRVISYETRIPEEKITKMLNYMVGLGLFEQSSQGTVTCPKMLERLDGSMVNARMRERIKDAKSKLYSQKKSPSRAKKSQEAS